MVPEIRLMVAEPLLSTIGKRTNSSGMDSGPCWSSCGYRAKPCASKRLRYDALGLPLKACHLQQKLLFEGHQDLKPGSKHQHRYNLK